MAKGKRKERLTRNKKFRLRPGQRLVICFGIGSGMFVIHAECKKDGTKIDARAESGSSGFKFSDHKEDANNPYFFIGEPRLKINFADRLRASFLGQFTWGDLHKIHEDRKLTRKINRAIWRLADKFEREASEELNSLFKR